MPFEFVIQRRAENRRRHCAARKIVRDLMQPEQLKMIDQEGAGQHDQPAHEGQSGDDDCDLRSAPLPHHRRNLICWPSPGMKFLTSTNTLAHSTGRRSEMALRRVRESASTEYGFWISSKPRWALSARTLL